MSQTSVSFLLVEDDDVDVLAFERAMQRHALSNPLHVAGDGVEALAMLRGEDAHPPIQRPLIIVLDLNMPRMNGLEFLQHLRQDKQLQNLTVFVMTTSADERDLQSSYRYNIAGYMVKSRLGESLGGALDLLQQYCYVAAFP